MQQQPGAGDAQRSHLCLSSLIQTLKGLFSARVLVSTENTYIVHTE